MDERELRKSLIRRVYAAVMGLGNFADKTKAGALRGDALDDSASRLKTEFAMLLADVNEQSDRVNRGEVPCDDEMARLCGSVKDLRRRMKRAGL